MEIIAYQVGDREGWSLEPATLQRDWMDETLTKIAYRCLPLSIANQAGWFVRCPHSFAATWIGGPDGRQTHLTPIDVGETFSDQIHHNFGLGIISFALPWLFRTPPGWGMLVTGPINYLKPHAAGLTGLVETEWAPYSFTMNWKIVTPNVRVEFDRDDPICMLIPVQIDALEAFKPRMTMITEEPELTEMYRAWNEERRNQSKINAEKPPEEREYKMKYLRGMRMDGAKHDGHRTKMRIAPFDGQGERWRKAKPDPAPSQPPPPPAPAPTRTQPPPAQQPPAPAQGPITADRIFSTPELYLTDFDPPSGRAILARMSRQTYRDSVMLDQRMVSLGPPVYQTNVSMLARMKAKIAEATRPTSWIFHTAFCGSTLLARALDREGASVAYKEPFILHRLSEMKRMKLAGQSAPSVAPYEDVLALVFALLSRGWEGERAVVKPTDTCNNFVREAMEAHPESRAVLLYSTLEDFLAATLKSDERRAFVRESAPRAQADAMTLEGVQPQNIEQLSDAQAAAYIWTVQIRLYHWMLERVNERVATLDGARISAEPKRVLAAAARHLRVNLDEPTIDEIVSGPIYRKHAKFPGRDFDPQAAIDERERLKAQHRDEIAEGVDFGAEMLGGTVPAILEGDLLARGSAS